MNEDKHRLKWTQVALPGMRLPLPDRIEIAVRLVWHALIVLTGRRWCEGYINHG